MNWSSLIIQIDCEQSFYYTILCTKIDHGRAILEFLVTVIWGEYYSECGNRLWGNSAFELDKHSVNI